jgi:hypothetical protein
MLEIRILKEDEVLDWEYIVVNSPMGTIFHSSDWLNILERSLKIKLIKLAAYEEQRIVGVFPISIVGPRYIRGVFSPPPIIENPYGGPLTFPDKIGIINKFIRSVIRGSVLVDITFPPTFNSNSKCYSDLIPFKDVIQYKHTYIINLKNPEVLIWKHFRDDTKKYIKRAINEEIKVVEGKSPASVDIYYKMLEDTYFRQGFHPLPKEFYLQVFSTLKPKGQAKIVFAEKDGVPVAAYFFLIYKGTINTWTSASNYTNPYFKRCSPKRLIIWEIIKWAKENDILTLDLEGANIPNIAYFKESFKGEHVIYPYLRWSNWIGKRAVQVYNIMRKVQYLINLQRSIKPQQTNKALACP